MALKANKTKKSPHTDLRQLSDSIGDFIRYWGFRRIHGQIWTQLYLSKSPLSGVELVKNLKVSKALVSPALKELLGYGLIKQVGGDQKTKLYTAEEDVFKVIKGILETRELKLIQKTKQSLIKLEEYKNMLIEMNVLHPDHYKSLNDMTDTAITTLQLIIAQVDQP